MSKNITRVVVASHSLDASCNLIHRTEKGSYDPEN